MPKATTSQGAARQKKRICAPSSAREEALAYHPINTMDGEFLSSTLCFMTNPNHCLDRLNTSKKRRIRKGLMESVTW
jgi:hypothetical protein